MPSAEERCRPLQAAGQALAGRVAAEVSAARAEAAEDRAGPGVAAEADALALAVVGAAVAARGMDATASPSM